MTSPIDRPDVGRRNQTAGPDDSRSNAIWEVFARKDYDEPLHHVGTITEPDEDLALVSARAVYDEQPWIQMIIVPRSAIREAIAA